MPIDIQYWISNKRNVLLNSSSLVKTAPEFTLTDNFFYCQSGMIIFQNIPKKNDIVQNCGETNDNHIKFYDKYIDIDSKLVGIYDGKSPLLFCRVPNSKPPGVVCTGQRADGNFLITSGELSGCTACSVYLPGKNKIGFFHVGWTWAYNKQSEYTQETKNADLYRSIKLFLDPRTTQYGETQLSTDELVIKLKGLLTNFDYAYIHIYIQNNRTASNSDQRQTYTIDEAKKCIILRYYDVGDMYVSKFNNLFSVHFMKKKTNMLYDTIDRWNLEML